MDIDFKKKDGFKRSIELSKEYDLYRQDFCGWLVVAAVAFSAATAFFYMRLILLMFFHEPRGETVIVVGSRGPTAAAIGTAAFLTVALGVLPQAVLVVLGRAAMLMP